MAVTVYRWDDAIAPTLSADNGALIAVLDACLVNGYGAKGAAGWTKAYSDTNKAAYKQGTGSNGLYLRVDNSTSNQYPRLRGFATMSDVDTGQGQFPSDAQITGGAYGHTSSTTDSTARPWLLAADAKRFILYIGFSNTAAEGIAGSTSYRPIIFFGDILSYRPDDAYHTLIIASGSASVSANKIATWAGSGAGVIGHYMARSNNQIDVSVQYGKITDPRGSPSSTSEATIGTAGAAYPDPVTGGMLLAPIYIVEPSGKLTRGRLPGVWAPLHSLPGNPGDTISGTATGGLNGRSFILLDAANGGTRGRLAIETSDTWES